MESIFKPYAPVALLPRCLIVDETNETTIDRAVASGTVRLIDASNYAREKHPPELLIYRASQNTDVAQAITTCTSENYKDLLIIASLSEAQIRGAGLEQTTRQIFAAVKAHPGPIVFLERTTHPANATYEAILTYVPWAYRIHAEEAVPCETIKQPAKHRTTTAAQKRISALLPDLKPESQPKPGKIQTLPDDNIPTDIERNSIDELNYLLKVLNQLLEKERRYNNTATFMHAEGFWAGDYDPKAHNPPTEPKQMRDACTRARELITNTRNLPPPSEGA